MSWLAVVLRKALRLPGELTICLRSTWRGSVPDDRKNFRHRNTFEQEGVGPALRGGVAIDVPVHGGQQDNPRLREFGFDASRCLQTASVRQIDVHQDNLRLEVSGNANSPFTIRCFGNQGQVLVLLQEVPHEPPKSLVCISDQDLPRFSAGLLRTESKCSPVAHGSAHT